MKRRIVFYMESAMHRQWQIYVILRMKSGFCLKEKGAKGESFRLLF